jgi:predicted DCC family thiol-disulfide oxidoreductase YuxK
MRELTVLYDSGCALCVRCCDWLGEQRQLVPIRMLACTSEEARSRYGAIPWLGEELVVVSDQGDVWAGPAAFLVCMWTLEEWREWSYTLSTGALAPVAERFFRALSSRRRAIAALLWPDRCEGGTCKLPGAHAPRTAYR